MGRGPENGKNNPGERGGSGRIRWKGKDRPEKERREEGFVMK
jgi:hypothetical protein